MTVFTIGYEGIEIETFLELLKASHIETLVDVRELPLSRKPGFSKRTLAERLSAVGIAYVHMQQLGCPKPVRDLYRKDGNWKRYTDGFLGHLATQQVAVEDLAELARASSCALMCFEADYNRCHRSMVADAVRRHGGAAIEHIAAPDVRTANAAGRRPGPA